MQMHHVGWALLITGGVLSLAEGVAIADTSTSGIPFEQTAVGKIEGYIPNPTPLQLGTILLLAGATLIWVVPWARKHG